MRKPRIVQTTSDIAATNPLSPTKLIFPLQPLLLSDKIEVEVEVEVEVYYLKVNHEKDIHAGISA